MMKLQTFLVLSLAFTTAWSALISSSITFPATEVRDASAAACPPLSVVSSGTVVSLEVDVTFTKNDGESCELPFPGGTPFLNEIRFSLQKDAVIVGLHAGGFGVGSGTQNTVTWTFSDAAASEPHVGNVDGPLVTGTFRPSSLLSAFSGQPAGGDWILIAEDTAGADALCVFGFALRIQDSTAVVGDPHVRGFFGINFEFLGVAGARYALVTAPSFQINMELAEVGPAERFMTKMSVLFRNTTFVIEPWAVKTRRIVLIKHFESLGAEVTYDGDWSVKIELCPLHTFTFTTHHTVDELALNYLDFDFSVPGCHNVYGGVLGQTYQCKWAKETFKWSREMEDLFRLPALDTPSGPYSPTAMLECAGEDEYEVGT